MTHTEAIPHDTAQCARLEAIVEALRQSLTRRPFLMTQDLKSLRLVVHFDGGTPDVVVQPEYRERQGARGGTRRRV